MKYILVHILLLWTKNSNLFNKISNLEISINNRMILKLLVSTDLTQNMQIHFII